MTTIISLLAVIPCHNEEVSIKATLESIRRVMPNATIWVVDNASIDGTPGIVRSEGVHLLKEPQLGKGFAIRNAFSRIDDKFDAVLMVDGDNTYGMENLISAIKLITSEGYDMVVGSRVDTSESDEDHAKVYRKGHKLGNRIISSIFRALFKVPIEDTLSGWRVMSPGFVNSFLGGASGFEIETELNVHAYAIRASVISVPVNYKQRESGSHSKLRTYSDGLKILNRQVSLLRIERPILFYSILSTPWFMWSVALIINVLRNYFQIGEIPNFPSLIAGVGCFILGTFLLGVGLILDNVRQSKVVLARLAYALSRRR